MTTQKTREVQVVGINELDLSKSFVVWGKVGHGTQSRLLEKFSDPDYHVCIIRTPIVDVIDFMSLPVLGQEPALPKWILDLNQIRVEGQKKIVLIFDEINLANSAGVDIFEQAVQYRTLVGVKLAPSDIIIATGVLDGSGDCRETLVSEDVMDSINHYTLTR